jgi:hypothetical protein
MSSEPESIDIPCSKCGKPAEINCSGIICGPLCFTCDDFAHSRSKHDRTQCDTSIKCSRCDINDSFVNCSNQKCGNLCFTCDDFAHSQIKHNRTQIDA